MYIVQKQVDKRSKCQFAVKKKSLKKSIKIATGGVRTWALSLVDPELNQ